MEIRIGIGDYVVCGVLKDGKNGVSIRLLKNHGHEIDTNADDIVEKSKELCNILFEDMQSARLFQDQVNAAVMRMNGYEIKNN